MFIRIGLAFVLTQRGQRRREAALKKAEAFRAECQAAEAPLVETHRVPVRFPLLPRSRVRNELDTALYLTPWYTHVLLRRTRLVFFPL